MFWNRDSHLKLLKGTHKLVKSVRPYLKDPDIYPGVPGNTYFTLKQSIDRKGDDCEGNSTAIHSAMKSWGYEAWIWEGYIKTQKHSVVEVELPSGNYIACNAYGVVPSDQYFERYMINAERLTDEQLKERWRRYGVR